MSDQAIVNLVNESNARTILFNEVISSHRKGTKLEISDGYHTMDELYEHRNLLFVMALYGLGWFNRVADSMVLSYKSKQHHDGTIYDGWFIAGAVKTAAEKDGSEFLMHTAISYHLPLDMWDLLKVPEWPKALEYDGYTSKDVLERIRKYYL